MCNPLNIRLSVFATNLPYLEHKWIKFGISDYLSIYIVLFMSGMKQFQFQISHVSNFIKYFTHDHHILEWISQQFDSSSCILVHYLLLLVRCSCFSVCSMLSHASVLLSWWLLVGFEPNQSTDIAAWAPGSVFEHCSKSVHVSEPKEYWMSHKGRTLRVSNWNSWREFWPAIVNNAVKYRSVFKVTISVTRGSCV